MDGMDAASMTLRVDAHAHVFARGLPLAPGRRYAPHYDAPLANYLDHLDCHGFSHGVLVQPSFLGTDNGYMLDALSTAAGRLRGIAVVEADCSAEELARLGSCGVVGLRLNLIGRPDPTLSAEPWRSLLRRAAALGWQIEVQAEAGRLAHLLPSLLEEGSMVVIDHFGLPDPRLGAEDPGWMAMLARAADAPRTYLKLSAPYRLGSGAAVAGSLVPRLLEAFGPERLVFGTDWPHTQHEGRDHAGDALRELFSWLPDPVDRFSCLGSSAAKLFGFPPLPGGHAIIES